MDAPTCGGLLRLGRSCVRYVGEILDDAPTIFQFVLYVILEVKWMRTNNGKLLSTYGVVDNH